MSFPRLEKLLQEAAGLPKVSPEAALAYKAQLEGLVIRVNQSLAAHPQIQRLIGYNPLALMSNNHYHHARFMANVFRFNAYALLVKTVIWAYRTYHNHGFAYDYFALELAAWQEAISALLAPSQAETILQVYRWLLDHHEQWQQLAGQPVATPLAGSTTWEAVRRQFLDALLRGDSRVCLELGSRLTRTPRGLEDFYLEILQPCMYEIGRLWEEGEISVAQEHLASALVARLMAVLYPALEIVQPPKGRAVVTAAPNEFHETGARCVADLLGLDGWEISYLGANTPTTELLRYLRQVRPHLLAISVAMPFNLDLTQEMVAAVREDPEFHRIKIMVGGLAFAPLPEIWQELEADGYAPDARGAVALARSWYT